MTPGRERGNVIGLSPLSERRRRHCHWPSYRLQLIIVKLYVSVECLHFEFACASSKDWADGVFFLRVVDKDIPRSAHLSPKVQQKVFRSVEYSSRAFSALAMSRGWETNFSVHSAGQARACTPETEQTKWLIRASGARGVHLILRWACALYVSSSVWNPDRF